MSQSHVPYRLATAQYKLSLYKWGGRWDSNPWSPVPQTGALTNYATSTIFLNSAYIILNNLTKFVNTFSIKKQKMVYD